MGQNYHESLEVALLPSRLAGAFVALAGGTTLLLLAFTPVGWPWRAGAALAVMVACLEAHARLRRVRAVRVDREGALQVSDRRGHRHSGLLREGSFVAPWLTIIRWRPEGARFDRTVLVLPDMIEPEAFRRLRVLLRWG